MESLFILTKSGKLVRFHFNAAQEIIWRTVAPMLDRGTPVWLIFLKARQEGVSTFTQALMFVYNMLFGNAESMTLAHDFESSDGIFDMSKRFYDNFEIPKVEQTKRKHIVIPTAQGKLIYRVSTAGAKHKARGKTMRSFHGSEVAFWPVSQVLLGVLQTLPQPPEPTLCVLESTANGKSNEGELFYKLWTRSEKGDARFGGIGFTPIFLPWFALPSYRLDYIDQGDGERAMVVGLDDMDEDEQILTDKFHVVAPQLAWRRFAIHTLCHGDLNKFHQEYPAIPEEAFISSGLPVFDARAIMRHRANVQPPRGMAYRADGSLYDHPRGELRLWKQRGASGEMLWPPLDGHRYIIGADTAQGWGGNLARTDEKDDTRSYAAAEIFDADSMEQVGEWHGPTPSYEFGRDLYRMAKTFNEALLAIEMNANGRSVQERIMKEFHYAKLHPWRGKQDKKERGEFRLYGWETNSYSRHFILDTATEYVHTDIATIRSGGLLYELADLSKSDTGRYEAEAGKDDRAIAFMIACQSRRENYYPKQHWGGAQLGEVNWAKHGLQVRSDPHSAQAQHWNKVFGKRMPKNPWAQQR